MLIGQCPREGTAHQIGSINFIGEHYSRVIIYLDFGVLSFYCILCTSHQNSSNSFEFSFEF